MKKIAKKAATSSCDRGCNPRRLVVPDHKEVAKETLRVIIKQAGLTV